MLVVKAILAVLFNLIVYFLFGSLATVRSRTERSLVITEILGFFLYYALFAVCTLPIMLTYRPLSMLSYVWAGAIIVISIVSIICNAKSWRTLFSKIKEDIAHNRTMYIVVLTVTVLCAVLVSVTYNFTLDAAYYVANVSTSVDTNMINVYDPFTGAWQDHYELRYAFATYSINDAVVCFVTGIPALVQTKTVMSATVIILVNMLYFYICAFFHKDDKKSCIIMYLIMIFINLFYVSLYTTSNFLMTRTYEGKSIVGNITVIAVFVLYMILVRKNNDREVFWWLFIICLGTATISSTANMIIPAEVFVLFVPYIVKNKKFKDFGRMIICILPEIVMMLMYVLYVKGFYAIHTYPR